MSWQARARAALTLTGVTAAWLALAAGCSSGSSSLGACDHAPGIDDGGPGACRVARRALSCQTSGGGCLCLTDGDGCTGCSTNASCADLCHTDEYALVCGGLPQPDASYADAPAECRSVSFTPGGTTYFCCPCH